MKKPSNRSQVKPKETLFTKKLLSALVSLSLVFLPVTPALAADAAWNVLANGAWGTSTNWTPAAAPGSTSSTTNTDRAAFSYPLTDYTITISVDAGRNIKYIDFDHSSSNSARYLLSGGSLLLTDGGVIQTLAGNGNHTDTISSSIAIQGNGGMATFTAGATSPTSGLSVGNSGILSASVTGVSTSGNITTLTLNGSNTGTNTVAGIIGDGSGGGKLAVVKSGDGVWVLSRANTYTGGLTLNAGTLLVVTNAALGSAGTLNLNGGTFAASGAGSKTVFNNSVVGGNFTLGQAAVNTGAVTLSGAMDLGGAVRQITVNNNSDTISGVISNGGITKLGSGRLILYDAVTNANTYTGATTISDGILTVKYINDGGVAGNLGAATSDAANLVFDGGTLQAGTATTSTNRNFTITNGKTATFDITANSLTLSGASTATTGALTKTGIGTLVLAGSNLYGGETTLSEGKTTVAHNSGLGTAAGGTSVADGASLQLSGGITVAGEALTLNGDRASACNLWNLSGDNTWGGNITITKTSGVSEYSTAGINSIGTTSGTLTITGNIIASTSVNPGDAKTLALNSNGSTRPISISGIISDGAGSNPLKILVAGGGISRLSGSNSYTGSTTLGSSEINAATLEVYGGNAIGDSSAVQFYNTVGASTRLLELKNANETVGSIGTSGALAGPAIKLNSYTLTAGGNNTSTAFTGVISGSGGSLTKTGSGTMTLSGTNTYTGITTISAGTLSVGTIGNGGVAGNLGQASSAAANLVFDGGTLQYTGANASTDRNFTITGGKTATIDVTANNLTMSGASLATTGGLTKTGAGILTLSGTHLYTGTTTITAGTLALTGAGSIIWDTSAVVHSGGTFDISGLTAAGETVGSLSGAGGSAVVLGGKNIATGNDNTDTVFAGVLSGSGGSLTKTGTGTMTFSGVNTYTGGTTISGGALSVGSSSALGLESNNLTIGSGTILKATDSFNTSRSTTLGGAGAGVGGTFEVSDGKTLTYTSSSVIGGTGSLIKTGTGTLSLGGVDTYTGGTYIKAGTLVSTSGQAPGPQPPPGSNLYAHHIYDGATLQIAVGSWSTERQIELVSGTANIDITNGFTQQRNGLIYGAGKLNVNGTGRMTVTNANTYTGGTVIQNGTLQVNNSTGSATGTGAVTVKTGGTLSGLPTAQGIYSGITGSVEGPVTVESGGKLLTQSGGTLTLGGLTLNAGALSTFQLGVLTGIPELINIIGAFTLAGASTVEIVNTGLMEVGTYSLFGYAGVAPVFANLSLASTHLGAFKLALKDNTGNASIDLLVEAINNQWIQPGGGNKLWSTVGNWFLGDVPNSSGADANFGKNAGSGFGTAAETVTVDASKTVGSINFNNADTAFTIDASAGQSLIMDESGGNALIQVLSARSNANHVISAPLILADNLTVNIASGTYGLDISGAISGAGKTLTKTGSGPLTLSGTAANTYTGLTTVSGGTLNLNKDAGVDAIGTGGLQIDFGATASLLESNQINDNAIVTVNGTFALGASSETITALGGGGAVTTGSGSVLTLNSGTDSSFIGTISGTGGLGKSGVGVLRLSGVNTYTGGTTINAGTFEVDADNNLGGSSGSITFGGGTLSFSGGFTSARSVLLSGNGTLDTDGSGVTWTGLISGAGVLTKAGTGTIDLNHANTYTGATIINGGILRVSNALSLGSVASGTTVNAGGEIELNGSGLTLNEPLTLHGGEICNLANTNTYNGAITLTANSEVDSDSDSGLLIITGAIDGSFGLTKSGPGTVKLSGANTYSGATIVNEGTLQAGVATAAFGLNSAVTLANLSGVIFDLNGFSNTIGSLSGGGTSGGNVLFAAATLTTGGLNTDTAFAGVLSGAGGSLTKIGTGTMTLSGVNTYTGGTTISGGALSVGSSSALGLESNNLTIGSGTILKATDSFNTSRSTTLGGAGAGVGGTFEVSDGKTLTYTSSSVIGGTGSLIKTGTGTLSIAGVDNYEGGTYIKAGTLVVASGTALGPLPTLGSPDYAVHMDGGATIQLVANSWASDRQLDLVNGTANVDVTSGVSIVRNGSIYGAGAMNSMGAGTLIINNGAGNANAYTGGTVIQNGTLQINNTAGSAAGTGAVTVKTGGTLSGLTAQGSSTGTTGSISGTVEIQNTGKLLTQSGGTLTLGGLTLNAGALSTFQLGALTATKLINITGSNLFNLAGASTIEIVNSGLMAAGTYSLFGYAGTALTDISFLTLAADHVGVFSIALVNNEAGNSIDLDVTSVTTGQWTGAVNANWSTAGNWSTGIVPDGTGAGAQFVSGTAVATVDASKTVGSITFDNSTTAFTITSSGASTLTLDESGGNALIQVLSAPNTANHVISAPLVLADNLTVNIASGTYGLDISGVISESVAGTTLTKTGDGPLTLSGTAANTYTGLTTVSDGTLNLNKTAGVDAISTGGLQIDYGATAALLASNQIDDSAVVTVNGTFALGTSSETVTALGGGGAVTTGSGSVLTLNSGTDSSFIGTISGTGGLAKSGVGALRLSGVNTYTGGTTINAGTLQVDADNNLGGSSGSITFGGGTLSFSDSFTSVRNVILSGNGTLDTDGNDVMLTGQISGAGGLTATGAGTLTLSAVNNYTGATTIDAGSTLALDATGTIADSSGIVNNGTLTIAASKTIDSMTGTGGTTLTSGTLTLGDASATVATYGGVLSGAGNLATGAFSGSLTLSGVNTYTGSTTIGAGSTLALDSTGTIAASSGVMNNGILTIAASKTIASLTGSGGTTLTAGTLTIGDGSNTSSTYNGILSGAGGIKTAGAGTLTLGGANTFSGATEIVSGSALGIASGGDLGGGAVTHAGTFNIGLNTVNVAAYTMGGAATLNVSIDGATHGSIVGTGAATVNGTDTLVLNVSNYIENNATYTIIDGSGGAGVAAPVIQVAGNTHAIFTATTVGEDLILTASRSGNGFASDAPSGDTNAEVVGAVLDGIQNASGDMLTVLNTLDGESPGNVGDALQTMTPDVSSGQSEASRAITSQGFAMVSNRLGGARSGGFVGTGVSAGEMLNGVGVWMQGLGSYMKQGERKGIEGYKANVFGTTIGVDKLLDSHFRAGFAGSYGWARVNSKTPGSPSDDINSYQATIYGSYDSLNLCEARKNGKNSREAVRNQGDDFWYVDGMAAFTQNNYDSRREIWLTPTNKRVAKADHYGQQYSTNFETGYTFTFEKTKKLEVTPFAGLGYNYLYMNKYKEKGANALNLTVNGEGYQQLEQSLGMKLAYPIVNKKIGTFIPSAKAAWLYDYIGDRFQTTASFAGGGSSFDTIGAKPAKSGMLFGTELAFLNKGNMTLTGNWDIELKDQFMSNTYYGTVRYDF